MRLNGTGPAYENAALKFGWSHSRTQSPCVCRCNYLRCYLHFYLWVLSFINPIYNDCKYVIYALNDILILKHFMGFELAVAAVAVDLMAVE